MSIVVDNSTISELWERYWISQYGFLEQEPIKPLQDPIYAVWEELGKKLPQLNKEGLTKHYIDEYMVHSIFPVDKLKTRYEYQRAYALLSMIVNSYVWNIVYDRIPRCLAVPLYAVSNYLGINPILTHSAVDLYNWELIDPTQPFSLDNIKASITMTGEKTEDWFYVIMIAIEGEGGNILKHIIELMDSTDAHANYNSNSNSLELIQHLDVIQKSMEEILNILDRLREHCDPEIFWKVVRPYLAGWENNPKLPHGVIYEGVHDYHVMYCGGNAAQSSLFATIDAAFSIKHEDKYFTKIRNYMTKPHREFIIYIENTTNIRNYIKNSYIKNSNDADLIARYNKFVEYIVAFRKKHYALVHSYVLKFANPSHAIAGRDITESNTESNIELGTGGTPLRQFLSQTIKDTMDAKLHIE